MSFLPFLYTKTLPIFAFSIFSNALCRSCTFPVLVSAILVLFAGLMDATMGPFPVHVPSYTPKFGFVVEMPRFDKNESEEEEGEEKRRVIVSSISGTLGGEH